MRAFFFIGIVTVLAWPVGVFGAPKAEATSPAPSTFKNFKEAYAAGNQALKDRKFQEAISDYAAAENLASTPKAKGQAANAQGWACVRARKWEEAKIALSRAVEEDNQNKVALKNMGVACFRLYEYGFGGVEELKEAVKNLEASGENQELLERAKGALSREEAYAQTTPVPETNGAGMNFKSLQALGDKLQSQGQFTQALKVFKQAEGMGASPSSKGTAANRQGLALLAARRPSESVAFFEQAVKYQPEEKVYLNNLGFSYWVLYDSGKGTTEDLKKAVDACYKGNSIDPSYHAENLKTYLDELKEVDPEAAKAYVVKDDKEESASEGNKEDKDGDEKEDSK